MEGGKDAYGMGGEGNLVGSALDANVAPQWFSEETFPCLKLIDKSVHSPNVICKSFRTFCSGLFSTMSYRRIMDAMMICSSKKARLRPTHALVVVHHQLKLLRVRKG